MNKLQNRIVQTDDVYLLLDPKIWMNKHAIIIRMFDKNSNDFPFNLTYFFKM